MKFLCFFVDPSEGSGLQLEGGMYLNRLLSSKNGRFSDIAVSFEHFFRRNS